MATSATAFRQEIRNLLIATFYAPPAPGDTPAPAAPFEQGVKDGRLPRLFGFDGGAIGVYPRSQSPKIGQMNDLQTEVVVQFYGRYQKKRPIDPKLVVSPAAIEAAVEKFQTAVQGKLNTGSTASRWFYNVTGVSYPTDPVGQITRAEVTLQVHGSNPAIVESGL